MHHLLPNFLLFLILIQASLANCCIEHERKALLNFKGSVTDPSNHLASWSGNKCCNWAGIRCSNRTGRVIKLDLQNSYFYTFLDIYPHYEWNNHSLSGKISPALQFLSDLKHLDLSYNNFSGNKFPKFISNFKYLNYLNLSSTGLSGIIPPELGNLSKLQYLSLNHMPNIFVPNLWWLSRLTSLKYLDMEEINFLDSKEWAQALNTLPLLQTLYLGGNNITTIPASINALNFSSLKVLSVMDNSFNTRIPDWIGKLTKLTSLILGNCSFVGPIPNQLGHLTSIKTLHLWGNNLEGPMPPLHNLRNLTDLQISGVNFGEDIREVMSKLANKTLDQLECLWLSSNSLTGNLTGWVSKLRSLNMLYLYNNNLNGTIPTEIENITSLESLDLSANSLTGEFTCLSNLKELYLDFNNVTITVGRVPPFQLELLSLSGCKLGPHFPPWLQNQTRMNYIDLSNTGIVDTVPNWFWNYSDLYGIYLSDNQMTGMLPLSLEHLTILGSLDLSNNRFEGGLPSLPHSIIRVDLSHNLLSGPLPHHVKAPLSLEHLTNLYFLYLSNNRFEGGLPSLPHSITRVDLSYNLLSGPLPNHVEAPLSLEHLTILYSLDLSNNQFEGGLPSLPHSITWVDLSHNLLSGPLPHHVKEPLSLEHLKNLDMLDLSNNRFEGGLPSLPHSITLVDLSHNLLSGPLPHHVEAPSISSLDLSNNKLNGTIEHLTCGLDNLVFLNLAENNLSGNLPHCWPTALRFVNMAHNKLSGVIPSSMGSLIFLKVLQLNNNSLTGELPSKLQFCQNLIVFDIGENKISGQIPHWIGESLNNLTILRLRSNMFFGKIPVQLMYLSNLQVLDCANNNISGSIPPNLELLNAMASSTGENSSLHQDFLRISEYYNVSILVETKGLELEFTTTLSLFRSIDLSSNNLTGEIPRKITTLLALRNLNLSKNHLYGSIPMQIGQMQLIESLDLRMNELSGIIPKSLANLNFLTTLNLSYNNLSGPIPSGYQLQSLDDPYIYVGNNYLCGTPLSKSCSNSETPSVYEIQNNDDRDKVLLCLFVVFGFVLGFWAICGMLLFKANWRYCFFQMVDNVFDSVYVFVAVYIARLMKADERSN